MSRSPDRFRRTTLSAAVLDLGVCPEPTDQLGEEEQEFLAALRRIVERSPADELWDEYRGSRPGRLDRVFARFAD